MSALIRVVRGGVVRRRVQTWVMTLTTLLAVGASVLATGLIVASQSPFDKALARQHGAHLTAQYDGGKATTAQIAATRKVSGVTDAAGPYPVASLAVEPADLVGPEGQAGFPPLTVVGRATSGGAVDRVSLVHGRWAERPGEIVLAEDKLPPALGAGSRVRVPDAPGKPELTVVGIARSVGESADAWTTPAQLGTLRAKGAPAAYEMLYRVSPAATSAQLKEHKAALAAAVPHGALNGTQSYLTVRQENAGATAAFVPFIVVLGVLGLCMSVLIIGTVVSGMVGAGSRRIGILKSLGCTPRQVAYAYAMQALLPALVGTALGIALGNVLAVPMAHEAEGAYGSDSVTIPLWVDLAVPAAALVLVAAAAAAPALRAARLRTVEAIALGHTPRVGRGRGVQRLLGRLRLPRPLSLGLANPWARPGRSAAMGASVVFGAMAVTFAVGLTLSLDDVENGRDRGQAAPVIAVAGGKGPGPNRVHAPGTGPERPPDPAKVAAAVRAHKGTKTYYGQGWTELTVPGVTGSVEVIGFQGDASWVGYDMIEGRWFTGPGEAVAPTPFLNAAGVDVGDTVTVSGHGHTERLTIVGEVFDMENDGKELMTDLAGLGDVAPDLKADRFSIDLTPGTEPAAYAASLNSELEPMGAFAATNGPQSSSVITIMKAMATTLTLLLVAVAGLGVLNTVVLDTRARVHDLGVMKALGMAPRQTVAMVLASVTSIGLLAGAAGVPLGVLAHHSVLPMMTSAAGIGLPPAYVDVYGTALLLALGASGIAIAAAGALLPAGWAARMRVGESLRTE